MLPLKIVSSDDLVARNSSLSSFVDKQINAQHTSKLASPPSLHFQRRSYTRMNLVTPTSSLWTTSLMPSKEIEGGSEFVTIGPILSGHQCMHGLAGNDRDGGSFSQFRTAVGWQRMGKNGGFSMLPNLVLLVIRLDSSPLVI